MISAAEEGYQGLAPIGHNWNPDQFLVQVWKSSDDNPDVLTGMANIFASFVEGLSIPRTALMHHVRDWPAEARLDGLARGDACAAESLCAAKSSCASGAAKSSCASMTLLCAVAVSPQTQL